MFLASYYTVHMYRQQYVYTVHLYTLQNMYTVHLHSLQIMDFPVLSMTWYAQKSLENTKQNVCNKAFIEWGPWKFRGIYSGLGKSKTKVIKEEQAWGVTSTKAGSEKWAESHGSGASPGPALDYCRLL